VYRACPLDQSAIVGLSSGLVSKGAIVRDLVRFLARRKRYWLLPMALTLLVLGLLLVLTEGSAVAPFIYTLF
jgi:hypothetical protein